ncbi:MAG: hypothetical protein E6955_07000, partial [Bifidobacterium longum]|nr:hypothetical protein [Bifidobacterium longum]
MDIFILSDLDKSGQRFSGQKLDKHANQDQLKSLNTPHFKSLSQCILNNTNSEQHKKTWAHNPEVTGSNPVPATNRGKPSRIHRGGFLFPSSIIADWTMMSREKTTSSPTLGRIYQHVARLTE